MEEKLLDYRGSKINYLLLGSGFKLAFCFHGYGESVGSFSFLEKHVGVNYTFIAIDLPFHGKNVWDERNDFLIDDLINIVNQILSENDLRKRELSLTLMGFSLGGRIALSLFQAMPDKIEKIILLAPDGLKVNFWYWLSTQTWIGNKFFSFTMKHPGWFFGFLKLANFLRLVNASIFKFVNFYIGDKEVRRLLYLRWTSLRKLKPISNKIKSLVRQNKIKVELVYGKYDRIILSSVGEKFRRGIEDYCNINVINSGHQVLHEKHVNDILPLLKDNKDNH